MDARERLYLELVGERWSTYYRDRFAEIDAGSVIGFNTEAALTPFWGYRRVVPVLQLTALGFVLLGIWAANRWGFGAALLVPTITYALAYGLFGDWLYARHLRGVVAKLEALEPKPREQLLERQRVRGGLGHIVGSIPLLLLTCLVLMTATPNDHDHFDKAYRATIKADLRNLVTAQEAFRADSQRYALQLPKAYFEPSSGVTIEILYADSASFGAIGTHARIADRCWIFNGRARDLPLAGVEPTPAEGEPFCRAVPPDSGRAAPHPTH